ncbi:hypothetical protein PWW31_29230 [Vibrio harveyi]|nr:hypothetical protein PWW31_29230 [Vibrio harveyi]
MGGDKNEHQDENRSGWVEVISINHGPRDGFNEVVSVYGYYEEPDFGSQSEFAKAWVVAALINKGASQDVIDSVARDLDANSQNIRDAYRTATMMAAVGAVLSRKSATRRTQFGIYRPDRKLPRTEHGVPVPDSDLPHTQLGVKKGRKGAYTQAREWGYDLNGKLEPKRDIDFTDHGRPQNHPNPHQHDWEANPTGGTPQHGFAKPLELP